LSIVIFAFRVLTNLSKIYIFKSYPEGFFDLIGKSQKWCETNVSSVKQVFMKKDFLKVGLGKCIKKCKQLSKN